MSAQDEQGELSRKGASSVHYHHCSPILSEVPFVWEGEGIYPQAGERGRAKGRVCSGSGAIQKIWSTQMASLHQTLQLGCVSTWPHLQVRTGVLGTVSPRIPVALYCWGERRSEFYGSTMLCSWKQPWRTYAMNWRDYLSEGHKTSTKQ